MDSPMESSSRDAQKVDVLIGGAGFAGLALAIALRQGLAPSFSVTVADPALGGPAKDGRASAIVAAARRLFETIGVWQEVEAQPILDMVVTDSRLADVVRPAFLSFDGDVEPGEPFAHMIENGPLLAALAAKAKAEGVALRPAAVTEIEFATDRTQVRLSNGEALAARLLVAADGARSAIRERAGIASHGWSYGQSAIVTIVALPEAEFHAELERRFGLHLGEIAAVGPRRVLPLGLSVARAFIADRLALVGDAAHVIHPIAGQGLNMGLKDVAALAEVIVDAVRLGLDPGSLAVLERYQRWRRFDTMAMGIATDGLNRLFSNQSDVLRLVRDVGLGLVDRLPALKHLFIREAAGLVGEVPKLLRGEAL